ncbi:hypothetical protein [Salegentibacter sp. F14]
MKANIFVTNLMSQRAAQRTLKKISSVPGLSEIKIDAERTKISFKYNSDEAVFSLLSILKNITHPYITGGL